MGFSVWGPPYALVLFFFILALTHVALGNEDQFPLCCLLPKILPITHSYYSRTD